MRRWLHIIRGSLSVTRSAGLYPISTSIRTRPTTGWMTQSILVLQSQDSLLLILTRLSRVCILTWTFKRLPQWGEPWHGWLILELFKEVRKDQWFSHQQCSQDSFYTLIHGSLLTQWMLKMIFILIIQLQICTSGFCIKDWEILLKISMPFNSKRNL
jgi:hypothetical protein